MKNTNKGVTMTQILKAMMINKSQMPMMILLLLITIIIITMVVVSNNTVKKMIDGINESPTIGDATVIAIKKSSKHPTYVQYYFITNSGQKITARSTSLSGYDDYFYLENSKIIGHVFKVIYNEKKPIEYNKILISDGEFELFKCKKP